jgi:hypothetical protein
VPPPNIFIILYFNRIENIQCKDETARKESREVPGMAMKKENMENIGCSIISCFQQEKGSYDAGLM